MANLIDLFKGEPLSVTIRRIQEGLKAPKDSGEYKYARYAMTRIVGPPSISFACSLLLVITAVFMAETRSATPEKSFEASIVEPETKKTDDVKPEEEKVEPPVQEELVTDRPDLAPGPASPINTPGPTSEYSSGDKSTDTAGVGGDLDVPMVPYAAVMTKSPVVIKGLYGNRTKGGREAAGKAYGGGGGAGFAVSEKSVLLALRWLKKYQEADGSWTHKSGGGDGAISAPPAFTAMALLCYLAHGETPASEEFGYTVEKGIRWLVENQEADGRWKERGSGYCLPIAAYALCEAYGMTKVPTIQAAAEKSIDTIIKGQNKRDGWDYDCKPTGRSDTSVMAWCAQAIKAAHMAGLSNQEIKPTMKRAIEGFKVNAGKVTVDGEYAGFGYDHAGSGPLTGAGTLCMQLLGGAKEKECQNGILWLNRVTFDWSKPWGGERPIYYWYYITQAKFHAGCATWTDWNKMFSPVLCKQQVVLKGAGIDGKDIGYWDSPSAPENRAGRVYSTTLCCLMLEVYYRYLPTFKTPLAEGEAHAAEAPAAAVKAGAKPDEKAKAEEKPSIVIE